MPRNWRYVCVRVRVLVIGWLVFALPTNQGNLFSPAVYQGFPRVEFFAAANSLSLQQVSVSMQVPPSTDSSVLRTMIAFASLQHNANAESHSYKVKTEVYTLNKRTHKSKLKLYTGKKNFPAILSF